uniref:BTB_2 domain-containing protein n=1 Tax=Meloidogyne hapla TaxID=6305 RepID=A0A1I8C1I3_MELHA
MKYDQLVTHVDELGEGDISLGCIRFFQQRGILHRERICDRCGKDMRISTDRGNYVRRSDMLADPRSKLADWFRPGAVRLIPTDRAGNVFIDSDSKTFRHILAYLRFKKERFVGSLALPSLPDELSKLVGECEALNLAELKEIALEMLHKYLRMEEQHYMASYVQMTIRDLEAWQFEKEQQSSISERKSPIPQQGRQQIVDKGEKKPAREHSYDEWDNI